MIAERVFVDTNILVYAYDRSAGEKHHRAATLLSQLWDKGGAIISTQVLQEFAVVSTRKLSKPLSVEQVCGIITDLTTWEVVVLSPQFTLDALKLTKTKQLSFWDAMIITAAIKGAATVLYSEDLGHGCTIAGVRVNNPLAG